MNGLTDSAGDGCDWYSALRGDAEAAPSSCGAYDRGAFIARDLCCACGGGAGTPPCHDNPEARDWAGDGCDWYRNNPEQCGHHDRPPSGFIAADECSCACGGTQPLPVNLQVKPKIPAILATQAKPSMNLSAGKKNAMMLLAARPMQLASKAEMHQLLQERADLDVRPGQVDSWGDGCSWYATHDGYCGDFDTADFVAADLCVACGGGAVPALDRGGDGCSWYAGRPGECGKWDDEDFHAHADCVQCADVTCDPVIEAGKEGRDLGGDDCSWYIGRRDSCGFFDTETFKASDLCCACAGNTTDTGLNLAQFPGFSKAKLATLLATRPASSLGSAGFTPLNLAQQAKAALLMQECVNTDVSASGELRGDRYGDSCAWYAEAGRQGYCGDFDTDTFVAGRDCCACGGGTAETCVDDPSGPVDAWGDGCAWYEEHTSACGLHDHAGFTAATACCACRPEPVAPDVVSFPPVTFVSNSGGDRFGDSCAWYEGNEEFCGTYDTDSFTAATDCVECGGGTCFDGSTTAGDTAGDTCSWYTANPSSCGAYDDDDFQANVMCCACQNQTASASLNLGAVTPKKPVMNLQLREHGACSNTATATDTAGDGCGWYDSWPGQCGGYDQADGSF